MDKQEEINKLLAELLKLGHPIIIPTGRLTKINANAGKRPPTDMIVYPYYE